MEDITNGKLREQIDVSDKNDDMTLQTALQHLAAIDMNAECLTTIMNDEIREVSFYFERRCKKTNEVINSGFIQSALSKEGKKYWQLVS